MNGRTERAVGAVARRGVIGFGAVLLTVTGLTACGGNGAGTAAPAAVPVTQAAPPGADIYDRSCAKCHGPTQAGKEDAPALDAIRLSTLGDQRLRMAIQYGKGRMRGYPGITGQDLDDLVSYLNEY